MTVAQPLVLLAAGGTGGHLFPAEALALRLRERGIRVVLATDSRVETLSGEFPASEIVSIPSATPSGRSPLARGAALVTLGRGFAAALRVVRRLNPAVAVGFGGYPTVPPLLAAQMLRVPTLLHEQNAVMGRANAFLARGATVIATGVAQQVRGVPERARARRVHTGNPVRPAVLAAAATPYPPLAVEGPLQLLAFGGSQGARVMSEVVPEAVARLPAALRARLTVVQQARAEDLARAEALYGQAGLAAFSVAPFFKDLPARMAAAHLVVARSGASTVAELAVIGRPAILVPLPGSLDQDQAANAAVLGAAGAAFPRPQTDFTPERLAADLTGLFGAPERLIAAAAAAKGAGIPDAAERLAALVVETAIQASTR
ncbi:UDP-N-acetylglucosamine--N-acetylmuramyl-(pentapeptide) pyrophosphoryl-undecaprenol N-acetylglucosamine transferase [Methylobacterium nodulans]|uniref:UDP-N-acetylglucosamine--N-acetylmuramyl-(pentapeptide) pyrophosphoryl-undecaprenol N-acetylglucosamine transferase n=1 Tax=Methylobacterium nodulans (strain LMG 21967 / CNCM I-2342 / ORS 2060) TaxID=460265 RepID=MURG_METNO|nr:UDP-N-acetylglucosamine--N-acetylmuramyl-(pentapeptide) pyrophosphoryl-undecaprenol N-acetylglucosamine transferase [Methylobacterium nodulans]B8IN64.1 RecName: Full=UDP-N-acetylglucosamine--N-acetylmuramyl-(pentapeptide) pyrophosphoryl-undecaprenol N-acetylglucosamine transferase; AltName: Full=Undecaprenyl-PP-MurNAc-pentapeptide-UDPGlcNAc GlcNAc transferase [Methylobacterium nodulans ORS 2060]ACL62180.1 Glycosyltransferase 28 domain protein [Methylobacterium nodulans ORS 2060]